MSPPLEPKARPLNTLYHTFLTPNVITGPGFAADDGASLLMAFRGLQSETARQGDAHVVIAKELHTLVADPFQEWAGGHKVRF
jgi:hypothetical protein